MASVALSTLNTTVQSPEEKDAITTARPNTATGQQSLSDQSFVSKFSSEKTRVQNPFATPAESVNASTVHLSTNPRQPAYFRSRRIRKEEIEKPWLKDNKDKKEKWQTLLPMLGLFLGLCIAVYLVYDGWTSIVDHEYCLVLSDDFSSGSLNEDVWTKEAEIGGYGNGQFEETTITDENVYIVNGILTIKPTLQDEKLLNENSVVNLTKQGTCSSDVWSSCVAVTNTTNGTIVPPARSGRINTKKGAQIKFGRIEVVAKMPKGDWLWPAIWMLPAENVYGDWPLSGEIDIVETRGNNHTYGLGGNNIISSTMHWGPSLSNDAWWRTYGKTKALQTTFADTFHTFGLEWNEKYIYMYLNSRLLQVMYTKFSKPLWKQGQFALQDQNGTAFVDPWTQTGNPATPFDQNFYLILNVAVGGTNGWFEDGMAGKPWVDGSPTAKLDFWKAKDRWYPTWTDPAMQVDSVKIWQQKGYNKC